MLCRLERDGYFFKVRTTSTMHHHADCSRLLPGMSKRVNKIASHNKYNAAGFRLFAHQGQLQLSSPLTKELAVHAVANDSGYSASAVQAPTH